MSSVNMDTCQMQGCRLCNLSILYEHVSDEAFHSMLHPYIGNYGLEWCMLEEEQKLKTGTQTSNNDIRHIW